MLKKITKILIILIFFQISCFIIYTKETTTITIENNQQKKQSEKIEKTEISNDIGTEEKKIGQIIIEKINLNKELYEITSKKNNIEENVTILPGSIEPSENDSIMFIAAHSGTGNIAFFKDLDKIQLGDIIHLEYKGKKYIYSVNNIWESNKDGDIEVTKSKNKQLILTTCSPKHKNKQLIISCDIIN